MSSTDGTADVVGDASVSGGVEVNPLRNYIGLKYFKRMRRTAN